MSKTDPPTDRPTDRPTYRPTDRPTRRPLEAPSRSLKIYAVFSTLKEVICECEEDKLHDSRENTIHQLDYDVETFMERFEKCKEDKKETLM